MNERLLTVNVIPVQDSFVHLSSKLIRQFNIATINKHPLCLKLMTMENNLMDLYVSCSQTPYNSNGDETLNISHELLNTLALKKSQYVLATVMNQVYPLQRIYVTPVTVEDWDLIVLNNISLQNTILQQLQIVYKNQTLPIWVSKFIHVRISIDELKFLGFHTFPMGLLEESTEVVIKPNILNPPTTISNNDCLDNDLKTNAINESECIPLTKYDNRFIFRTIFVKETLLESDCIYDYCALISKSHMSILFKTDNPYSTENSFVKIALLQRLDQTVNKENENKEIQNSLVIRLCPLDRLMNNVDKMENINWPTIYITNIISKMLGLKNNSKVVLKPIKKIDNKICDVDHICFYPLTRKNILDEKNFLKHTIQQLMNEIYRRKLVVLNNKSLIRVVHNKFFPIDAVVSFTPSNIPHIFLNEFNTRMIKLTVQMKDSTDIIKRLSFNEKVELNGIEDCPINTFKSEYNLYKLKCFKDMENTGSLCLKLGLKCSDILPHTFMEYDNMLITGPIGSGKTTTAKMFCYRLSKCPYFVKTIWINGRSLAGKLWDTVQKAIAQHFQESLYYQPAIIVFDDFDTLCHLNSEPNEHADMSKFYLRSLHLLLRMIESYTSNNHSIRVICTSKTFKEEHENLFLNQFKHVFKTIIQVPLIDKENRKVLISNRLYNVNSNGRINNTLLNEICEKMESYVIQDLIDFCDKVLFDIYKGGCDKMINSSVLNSAFEKTIPLSLHNVNLFKDKTINFSLVGGLKNAKQAIIETIIWPSIHSDIFSKCPLKLQCGLLLYGPPGSGKTLLAKAVVGESNLNFIAINGPEILSKYVGESEHSVRKIFTRALNAKPCVIFIDEFESIAPKRGSDQTGVTDRVVNQFLTQLDGVDTAEGIFVITATSRPDLIDGALLRPGRIGIKLHCPMPNTADREDILRVLCTDVKLSEDVNLYEIALETNNYTGADLKGLIYTAILIADKKLSKEQKGAMSLDYNTISEPTVTADDFRGALKTTKPSLQQSDIDRYDQIHRLFSKEKNKGTSDPAAGGRDGKSSTNQDSDGKMLQKTTYA